MAIYHSRIKTFSRAKGDSSVAAAAYRAGLLLVDHLTGRRHDYRHRGGVVESICLAPEGAPDWAFIPSELWPAAELAENRKNSTVAREFEVALPHELDDAQRSDLTVAISEALIDRYQFAIQASIHSPGTRDGRNFHVHILATTRRMTPDGFGDKTRELDGGSSGRLEVDWVRATVAELTNSHLALAGIEARVDHRRLEVQAEDAMLRGDWAEAFALTRQPTKHLGKNVTAMERKGMETERGAQNDQIIEENEEGFESLIKQANREGRAVAVPPGHSAAQARADQRRQRGPYVVGNGLIIEGLSGVRASQIGLGAERPSDKSPVAGASIEEMVDEAGMELSEVLALNPDLPLEKTRRLVSHWQAALSNLVDSPTLRRQLQSVVDGLKQLKTGLMVFAKRLAVVTRAERLFHMAEQAWEQFNADCPKPATEWMSRDWLARRGRRLAALDKRSNELKRAKAGTTDEARHACEAEVVRRNEALEHRSSIALDQAAIEAEQDALGAGLPSTPPLGVPTTRRRRPSP
ncbi:MobA/MobL family protein [Stenotrophomonas bentonitica]|uniref:MobA/MobL family protein n=1 Tax=Stenotrophomonas bentonitica TaxID=1450134 RepID=UPI0037D29151